MATVDLSVTDWARQLQISSYTGSEQDQRIKAAITATQPAPATTYKLRVNGSQVQVAADGKQAILRGVAEFGITDPIVSSAFGDVRYANRETITAGYAKAGYNLLRLRIYASYYDGLSATEKTAYVAKVKAWHDAAVTHGLLFMPCAWDALDGAYSGTKWPTEYAKAFPLWEAVIKAIGPDPNTLYEPFNEPNNVSWAQWQTAMKATVTMFRKAGYSGPLVIDPINWSNSGSGGGGYSDFDFQALASTDAAILGSSQLIFSTHQYANEWSGWDLAKFKTAMGGTKWPTILGEIGNYNGSPASVNYAWDEAALKDLATLGLSMPNFAGVAVFLGGPWYDTNGLSNADGSATRWGNIVLSLLLGNTTPPPPPPPPPPGDIVTRLSPDKSYVEVISLPTGADGYKVAFMKDAAKAGIIYKGPFPATQKTISPLEGLPRIGAIATKGTTEIGKWAPELTTVSATPPPPPPPPPPTGGKGIVGINTSQWSGSPISGEGVGVYVKDAVKLGAPWIRCEVSNATDAKRAQDLCHANGAKCLILIENYGKDPKETAGWAQMAKECLPFTDAVVGGKKLIECGNESFWPYYGRPAAAEKRVGDWAKMWARVLDVIEPLGGTIIVPVFASGSNLPPDIIGEAQAAVPGIWQRVHGVAPHPYGNNTLDDGVEGQWHYGLWKYVAKRLPGVPQWWTEIGQQVQVVGAEYQKKAAERYLADMAANSIIEAVFWFNGKDWNAAGSVNDNGWALLDQNDARRPAWFGYQTAAKAFA